MNNNDPTQELVQAPVVTYSNIPLDDDAPAAIGYDEIPPEALKPPEITVVDIQFKKGGKVYYFDPGSLTVESGDEVIIDTTRGAEYGFCAGGNHAVSEDKVVAPLRSVIRVATEADRKARLEYKEKEPAAFEICQQKILDHKLDMKLVSAEYSFDGSKILFYFTADGRVDFRDLVKDLAGVFRTRIELRQIGVRDEAKMLGGLGICGRPFCCKQFLDDFQPVSIKMAKTQNLSLNPTKISGTCGRLMCCLKYEQDAYESLLKTCPKQESIVNTCDGMGIVIESNLLKQTVKVRLDSDSSNPKCYNNCDICVLRNGKGKKTDAPIPTDLPPLPKPVEKPAEQESIAMFDETALGRYSEDAKVSEETAEQPAVSVEKAPGKPQENRPPRRNNVSRPKQEKRSAQRPTDRPVEAKKPRPPKPAAAADTAAKDAKDPAQKEGGKPKNYRRRYYRGQKKSGGQPQNPG